MAMPSRKRIALIILIVFLFIFFGGIFYVLYPVLFGEVTVDENGNVVRETSLFPFGNSRLTDRETGVFTEPDNNNANNGNQQLERPSVSTLPRLRKISEGPVIAGFMFSGSKNLPRGTRASSERERGTEGDNIIRYVELGTGHVYEGSSLNEQTNRISNTTIPKIDEALFINSDRIIIRYEDEFNTIKTFSAGLVKDFSGSSGVDKKLQGIFLNDNIEQVSVSQDGQLLYLERTVGNGNNVVGIVSDEIGEGKRQVFDSALSEWNVEWGTRERSALVTSRSSYNSYGLAYRLDTTNGSLVPYLPGRLALQVVANNDLSHAAVSFNVDGESKLYIWEQANNQYTDVGLSTFATKCLWAQDRARYYCAVPVNTILDTEPDLWYQGVTRYSDELWEIDPTTGRSSLVASPNVLVDESIDVVDIAISPDERYLYFRDKENRSLWSLQIDQNTTQVFVEETEEVDAIIEEIFFE